MAWNSDYLTVQEYAARTGLKNFSGALNLAGQITAVSRWLEQNKQLGRVFNSSGAGVIRYFEGVPVGEVWPQVLRADDFTAITAIAVDLDRDGSYSTSLTPSSDVLYRPLNADTDGRPFEFLELRPLQTKIAGWPDYPAAVKITGTWGWPAVPDAVKELTAMIVRQIRDLQLGGVTVTVQQIDSQLQLAPGSSKLMKELKAAYSRRKAFV